MMEELTHEQELCVTTLDGPLVVAAGAGSGKTFTLTERIVYAFETGYVQDIDQVMAITFTRKAAGELKSRIKAALRASGRVDQALKVDGAWISTIHSMCALILRAHALELGLDPGFKQIEDPDVSLLRARAIDDALKAARRERPVEAEALFSEYSASAQGFGTASVEGMLKKLLEAAGSNPAGADAFVVPESRIDPTDVLMHVAALVDEVHEVALQQKANKTRDEWLEAIEPTAEAIAEALAKGPVDAVAALRLLAPVNFNKRFGQPEYRALVDEARLAFGRSIQELRIHAASGYAETLAHIARDAYRRFADAKRAAGVLDNGDLLVLASRALDDYPRIRALYADAFKLIMVDEFQDTDQMQVDMVRRLAGAGFARLCTVGDAQQSIYRFRGADVSVYRRHLASVQDSDPGGVIELHDNFRSHPDVLSYVRTVFERDEMFGKSFMNLEPGRDEGKVKRSFEGLGPRITVLHTCAPTKGAANQAALRTAAYRLAGHFADLRAAGCPASDMVLLLGTMKNAGLYAQALRDVGIPCVITGGTVFPTSLEAQVVLDAVRVLADPHDGAALYRLLAGPLFCLEAEDLIELATGTDAAGVLKRRALDVGLFTETRSVRAEDAAASDCAEGTVGSRPRIACAARVLSAALDDVGSASVTSLVKRMVVDSGWMTRLEEGHAEGLASAGNVLKALRFLDREERAGGLGPAQLAQRFEALLGSLKEGPGALSAGEGDFVRIMTIHASKGLEFPVVALADLNDKDSMGTFLAEDVDGRICLSLDLGHTGSAIGGAAKLSGKDALPYYEEAVGSDADEGSCARLLKQGCDAFTQRAALVVRAATGEAEERKRLLYVALTRAKEALVVSLVGSYGTKDPTGIPSTTLAETARALGYGSTGSFERVLCDFGGTQPAVVERVALEAGQTAEEALAQLATWKSQFLTEEDVLAADGADVPAEGDRSAHEEGCVLVPLSPTASSVAREPLRLPRRGVFSYSSVADASHEGDVLERMAAMYAVPSAQEGADTCADAYAVELDVADDSAAALLEPDPFWDDDFWEAPIPLFAGAADADKATDLGTAFHRLAQYAVGARDANGLLMMPPDGRIEALARTCNLGHDARARLQAALSRWFASDIAASLSSCADLRAEVPFYVRVGASSEEAESRYLEGEIDLLALSEQGRHARVIDYKTGGRSDETPAELARKHVLQASCYAYALLCAGVESVEAVFVRVERSDPGNPDQPQCVAYRFESADCESLESVIGSIAARKP